MRKDAGEIIEYASNILSLLFMTTEVWQRKN